MRYRKTFVEKIDLHSDTLGGKTQKCRKITSHRIALHCIIVISGGTVEFCRQTATLDRSLFQQSNHCHLKASSPREPKCLPTIQHRTWTFHPVSAIFHSVLSPLLEGLGCLPWGAELAELAAVD